MALAYGNGGQDIEKLFKNLLGGLRGTYTESFPQPVDTRLIKYAAGSGLGYSTQGTNSQ
jgi:hypothetical protein